MYDKAKDIVLNLLNQNGFFKAVLLSLKLGNYYSL